MNITDVFRHAKNGSPKSVYELLNEWVEHGEDCVRATQESRVRYLIAGAASSFREDARFHDFVEQNKLQGLFSGPNASCALSPESTIQFSGVCIHLCVDGTYWLEDTTGG